MFTLGDLIEDIKKQLTYTYDHKVKYKNYMICQDKNTEFNDIIILKDNKEVLHYSCNKQYTDEELLNKLKEYIGENKNV